MEEITRSDYYKLWKRASKTYEPSSPAESVYALSSSLTPSNVVTLSAMVALFVGLKGTEPRDHAPIAEPMCCVRPPQPIL